jgi:hypothetical protein
MLRLLVVTVSFVSTSKTIGLAEILLKEALIETSQSTGKEAVKSLDTLVDVGVPSVLL